MIPLHRTQQEAGQLLGQLECSVPTRCLQLSEKEKGRGEVGFNPSFPPLGHLPLVMLGFPFCSMEPTVPLTATVLVSYSKHLF